MITYQTGYADQVPLKYYFKIKHNCYKIDIDSEIIRNLLKKFDAIKYKANLNQNLIDQK